VGVCLYFALSWLVAGQVESFTGYPSLLLACAQVTVVVGGNLVYWNFVMNSTSERVDILTYFWIFTLKSMVFTWYSIVIAVLARHVYTNSLLQTAVELFVLFLTFGAVSSWVKVYELMPGKKDALTEFYKKAKLQQKYHPFWEITKL
jgi:hypothetical protein